MDVKLSVSGLMSKITNSFVFDRTEVWYVILGYPENKKMTSYLLKIMFYKMLYCF